MTIEPRRPDDPAGAAVEDAHDPMRTLRKLAETATYDYEDEPTWMWQELETRRLPPTGPERVDLDELLGEVSERAGPPLTEPITPPPPKRPIVERHYLWGAMALIALLAMALGAALTALALRPVRNLNRILLEPLRAGELVRETVDDEPRRSAGFQTRPPPAVTASTVAGGGRGAGGGSAEHARAGGDASGATARGEATVEERGRSGRTARARADGAPPRGSRDGAGGRAARAEAEPRGAARAPERASAAPRRSTAAARASGEGRRAAAGRASDERRRAAAGGAPGEDRRAAAGRASDERRRAAAGGAPEEDRRAAASPSERRPASEDPVAEDPVAEDPVAEDPVAEDPVAGGAEGSEGTSREAQEALAALGRAPSPTPRDAEARGGRDPLPPRPSRTEVAAALRRVVPAVRRCAPDLSGQRIELDFHFAPNGRANSVLVRSTAPTPAQRTCMARAARQARIPPFSNPELTVRFPLRL
jgi:hypothetical protein